LTKREFAAKLLMWLLPWPISKVLPRSFRIYYFGPGAGPPSGWYDYWGEPGFYWPDPSIPPDPDLFPDLPDDIFNPGDPVNPPDPGDFPDFPDGPTNPSDPYTPGPGPVNPHPPMHSGTWADYTSNLLWDVEANGMWDGVKWVEIGPGMSLKPATGWPFTTGFYPSKVRVTYAAGSGATIGIETVGGGSAGQGNPDSGEALDINMGGQRIESIKLWSTTNVPKIEFCSEIHAN